LHPPYDFMINCGDLSDHQRRVRERNIAKAWSSSFSSNPQLTPPSSGSNKSDDGTNVDDSFDENSFPVGDVNPVSGDGFNRHQVNILTVDAAELKSTY